VAELAELEKFRARRELLEAEERLAARTRRRQQNFVTIGDDPAPELEYVRSDPWKDGQR
jgi:hypothetical protein